MVKDEEFLFSYPKARFERSVCLIYPNSYRIGMSALSFHAVYHHLQQNPLLQVERAFWQTEENRLFAPDSKAGLSTKDALFFTLSFEPDLLNLIRILNAAKIPVLREDRRIEPLIIVGGVATALLSKYLFQVADIVVFGSADLTLPPIETVLLESKSRAEILKRLHGKPGIYVSEKTANEKIENFPCSPSLQPAQSVILTDETEFGKTGLIEISRSCKFNCAFCLVGRVYGKYDFIPKEKIFELAEIYKGKTDRIGLVAATLTNHPEFTDVIKGLNRRGFSVSFSSLRAETLSPDDLKLILENGAKTLTLAPETASERLKSTIQKKISNERFYETIRTAASLGLKRLKLYFLIGLPGETEKDIEEMIEFVRKVREMSSEFVKNFGYIPEMIIDVNPFVPKPFTPLQNAEFESIKTLKKKMLVLKKGVRNLGRVFVYGESPKSAKLQFDICKENWDMKSFIEKEKASL